MKGNDMKTLFTIILSLICSTCFAIDPPKDLKWKDTYNNVLVSLQQDTINVRSVSLEDSLKYFYQDSYDYKRIKRQIEGGGGSGRDILLMLRSGTKNSTLITPLDLPTGVLFSQMNHWRFLNEKVNKGYLFFDSTSQTLIGVSMLFASSTESIEDGKVKDYTGFLQRVIIGYTEKYGVPNNTISNTSTLGGITSIITKQAGEGENWRWEDSSGNILNVYFCSRITQGGWLATVLLGHSVIGGQSAIIIYWRTKDYNDKIKDTFKNMEDL